MQNHQFKDSKGRVWTLVIRVSEYRMLRETHGIDIGDIFDEKDSWVTKLVSQEDMMLLPLILHDLCMTQCDDRDISDYDFFEGLDGDTLSSATNALIAAVANFIPAHKRAVLLAIVGNIQKGLARTSEKVIEKESEIQALLEKQIDQNLSLLMSNISSTQQQESAG